jgi:EmrB/QacA subfamily drug resistance transporter
MTNLPASVQQPSDSESLSSSANSRWWVLFALGISTFMAALDGSVVNTILPVISGFFASDIAHVQWVITIYMLVLSGLLLSFGRLGDLRGHKAVYMAGFGVFVASSALCGLAPNIPALIIFRGLQALGAAMLSANSPAILTKTFPGSQRGQALGMMATMTYLGLTVGPSFGGWLASIAGWRWVFYINLPVGLFALLLAIRYIPNDKGSKNQEQFDLVGAFAFTLGLITLLLGLNRAHEWGWTSPAIVGLISSSILSLGFFLAYENRISYPMLDLKLFRRKLFSISASSAVLNYICIYSVLFLMPFYLIQGRGLNPAGAGLLLTAQPIVMAIVAPISGSISDRIGTRIPTVFGMAILSLGLFFLSRLGFESTNLAIIAGLATAGLGTGIFISPNNSALMGAAPHARQGIAAGILATARNMGMALGVGFAGAIFTTILARSEAAADPQAFFRAISASFMAAAVIAAFGALLSFSRDKEIV